MVYLIFKVQYSNFLGYSRQKIVDRTEKNMLAYPEKMDVSKWSCLYTMDNYIALNLIFGTLFQNYVCSMAPKAQQKGKITPFVMVSCLNGFKTL